MNDIDEQYNRITDTFNRLRAEIERDIDKSNYGNSLKALLHFSDKIDQLGIVLQLEEINFYTSQVLMRVIFEHYLISDYIFTRSFKDKSDEVGEEYYKHYYCGEFFKRKSYFVQVDEIAKGKKQKRSTLEIIKDNHLEFKELTEIDFAEINRIKNTFYDLKKIGDYLIRSESNKKSIQDFNKAKLDLIKRYSDLSSYIHGGPTAEQDYVSKEVQEKEQIIDENQTWYKIASKQSKLNLLSLCAMEYGVKYLKELEKLKKCS